jgi:hypothetical protein
VSGTQSVRACVEYPFGEANPLGRGTIVIEAVWSIRPPLEQAVDVPPRSVSNSRVEKLRCSFCRGDLDESLELTIAGRHGHGRSTGSFCSTHCRNCVLALAALHPSPLAPDDFVAKRGLLTGRLLELWRQGRGPDPELVLQAAERAGCGLPTAGPARSDQIERPKLAIVKSAGRNVPIPDGA